MLLCKPLTTYMAINSFFFPQIYLVLQKISGLSKIPIVFFSPLFSWESLLMWNACLEPC